MGHPKRLQQAPHRHPATAAGWVPFDFAQGKRDDTEGKTAELRAFFNLRSGAARARSSALQEPSHPSREGTRRMGTRRTAEVLEGWRI
jgi:hypothetical protein